MASCNYKIGRNFEYRVIAYLRKLGYYCLRAYGSKGLYDIIAIPKSSFVVFDLNKIDERKFPLLIQAKSNGYINPKELENLKDNQLWHARHLIAYKENHKLKFRSLNGEEVLI